MGERLWEEKQREALLQGQKALERTSESLRRSEIAAIEAENVGTVVINELGQQREVLIRTSNRLNDIDSSMSQSRRLLNVMQRNVFQNKLILILIILCEIGIIACLLFLKIFKK